MASGTRRRGSSLPRRHPEPRQGRCSAFCPGGVTFLEEGGQRPQWGPPYGPLLISTLEPFWGPRVLSPTGRKVGHQKTSGCEIRLLWASVFLSKLSDSRELGVGVSCGSGWQGAQHPWPMRTGISLSHGPYTQVLGQDPTSSPCDLCEVSKIDLSCCTCCKADPE